MPVSRIENFSRTLASVSACAETCTVTLPRSVNFTALPARLISTWRRWCGSPRTAGGTSRHDRDHELDALGRGLRGDDAAGAVDQRMQVEVGLLERELAGLDLGEVEHVLDQAEHHARGAAQRLQHVGLLAR